ncbi:MAG: hypothetical protein N4A46_15950 [Schleiferiaceae bacterium]|nr:hypothetical protein [Schleiferiaceae bacterium]
MNHFKLFSTLALLILFLTAFKVNRTDNDFIGTYGTKAHKGIVLKVNANHTFNYQDFSDPKREISLTGDWMVHKNKLHLNNDGPKTKFFDKWTIDDKGCIQSKKGMMFYRICGSCD